METDAFVVLIASIFGGGGLISIMLKWITGRLTDSIDSVNRSVQTVTLTQMELYKLFLAHDAQVRGINPSTGEDQAERDREAVKNYQTLEASIIQLTKIIEGNLNESFKTRVGK